MSYRTDEEREGYHYIVNLRAIMYEPALMVLVRPLEAATLAIWKAAVPVPFAVNWNINLKGRTTASPLFIAMPHPIAAVVLVKIVAALVVRPPVAE